MTVQGHRATAFLGSFTAAVAFAIGAAPQAVAENHVTDLTDLSARNAHVCIGGGNQFRCYETEAEYREAEGLASTGDNATADFDKCEKNHVCLWDNMNFKGSKLILGASSSDLGEWRDRINSFRDRTGNRVKFTDKRTGQPDDSITYAPYQNEDDFGAFGWNNRIDKVEF
jgi:hypothetical protein